MRKMQIIKRENLDSFITKDGSIIREYQRSKEASLAEAVVKDETRAHYHKNAKEIYFILEGKGLMKMEDDTEKVTEDQAVIIPPGKTHNIKNIGESPLRILCFCTPSYTDEDTILVEDH